MIVQMLAARNRDAHQQAVHTQRGSGTDQGDGMMIDFSTDTSALKIPSLNSSQQPGHRDVNGGPPRLIVVDGGRSGNAEPTA